MPTRTTRVSSAPYFALAALGVAHLLMGCETNTTALHGGKVDAGYEHDGSTGRGGNSGTGGMSNTGGNSGTGGMSNTGGNSGTGGMSNTGGSSATGGHGGSVATGGNSSTGGNSGVGGKNGTGGRSGAGGSTSAPITACTDAGGTCVGVFPGSCATGIMNSSLSCGSGVGSTCCMPGGAGGNSGRGGNGGAAGQGGRAAGGATGQGGTGGRGTEPEAAACGKAGGICVQQGECTKQGGTVATESPAGCRFSDGPAECCITPAPKPNPTTCAEAGGSCASVSGCLMAGGYYTASNYECTFPGNCCVPNTSCGNATIDCCGDGVVYNAACQGGQFVCVVGTPAPKGTCKARL